MHRSVTTKILLPDMFLRRDTRKRKKLRNVDGYRFFAIQDAKKGRRSTMASDRRWIFK